MSRIVDVLLRTLGLTLVLIGVMGLTLLGPDGTWTVRTTIPEGTTTVLVEPSLASVLGPTVSISAEPTASARSSARPLLFLGRGMPADLSTFAGSAGLVRVVGLDGARRLDVRSGPDQSLDTGLGSGATSDDRGTGPVGPRPPAVDVDLWRQSVTGTGTRTLTWEPVKGAQSVLITSADGRALPELSLAVSWTDRTWVLLPVAPLVLGLALLALAWWLRRGHPTGPALAVAARGALTPSRRRGSGRGGEDVRPPAGEGVRPSTGDDHGPMIGDDHGPLTGDDVRLPIGDEIRPPAGDVLVPGSAGAGASTAPTELPTRMALRSQRRKHKTRRMPSPATFVSALRGGRRGQGGTGSSDDTRTGDPR